MKIVGVFLFGVVTITFAAPQYNYIPPAGSNNDQGENLFDSIALTATSGGSSHTNSINNGRNNIIGIGGIGGSNIGGSNIGGSNIGGFNIGSSNIGGSNIGGFNRLNNGPGPRKIYHKQIYFHSAPEEEFSEASSRQSESLSQRQNIRIIFIDNPENKDFENAALKLTKSAVQDRTAIYVLNKEADIGDLQKKFNEIQDVTFNKPEVHFIKYKTKEESDYAKRKIQSEYDKLTGPTEISNETFSSVNNYVGALNTQPFGVYADQQISLEAEGQGTSYAPQESYLPSRKYLPSIA